MKSIRPKFLLFIILFLGAFSCSENPKTNSDSKAKPIPISSHNEKVPTIQLQGKMTDLRDGETYATIIVGRQIWMAENLRFNAPSSILNPENPSKHYGRFYDLRTAQTACPEGWHLPSDIEWDELERAHGMPASFIGKGGWRGEHATNMKSTTGWGDEGGNGTNSLGFNVLPAGYYFTEKVSEEMAGIEGLGYAAAFWSALKEGRGFARFMFDVRDFVNKWDEGADEEMGTALSCRCVKD